MITSENNALVGQWIFDRTGGGVYDGSWSTIAHVKDGQIVAACGYSHYTGDEVSIHIASDQTRRSVTKEFLNCVFEYPFQQLKVKRLYGWVPTQFPDCIKFCLKLGFTVDRVLKDTEIAGDVVIFSMTPEQCRWLRYG